MVFVRRLLSFVVLIALIVPCYRLFHFVHISSSDEGWNAYHTLQIMQGFPLYQGLMTPVNYPPVSFFIVKSLSFLGDPLFIGRTISLLSFLVICFLVGKITKSYFYGVVCAAIFALLAPNYIGMNDPQMLGNAVMTFALYLYLTKKRDVPAMLLMAIALFIKVNLLALPLAVLLDSVLTSRRKGLNNLVVFGLASVLLLYATQFYSSNQFIEWVLIKRNYALTNLLILVAYNLAPLVIPLGAIFLESRYLFQEHRVIFFYLLFSLIIGLYFAGGDGTGANMFFDVYIATAIALGLLLSKKAQVICLLILALALGGKLALHTKDFQIASQEHTVKADIAFLQSRPGDALCRSIDECYFARKPFVYDHFLMGELVTTKSIPEQVILTPLEAKRYSIIQLTQPVEAKYFSHLPYTTLQRKDTSTENFYRALGNNYHLYASTDDAYFYIPN